MVLRGAKGGYVMFNFPAGRITDKFKELLGVEELKRQGVI